VNQLDEQTQSALWAAFDDGMGVNAASKFAGVSQQTASRYLRMLNPMPLCKCGQPVTHRGWCSVRFANSPKRKKFMERWNGKAWRKHKHTIKVALHSLRGNCLRGDNPAGVKLLDKVLVELFGTTEWP
jgi:hypothetical protein